MGDARTDIRLGVAMGNGLPTPVLYHTKLLEVRVFNIFHTILCWLKKDMDK